MKKKNSEPSQLRKGKEFHKKIQKEWLDTAEGNIMSEKSMIKSSGRKGRIDIFVESNKTLNAIVEIKDTCWDSMTSSAVKRNIRRYTRQIWNYIESQLETGKDVSPGIIFSNQPKDPDLLNLIEQLFDQEGIPVVWKDESISKRKARK